MPMPTSFITFFLRHYSLFKMGSKFWIGFVLLSLFCGLGFAEEVKLTVKGVTTIAKTDDNFVCATLDWWPVNKCDYNQCPWQKAGILNLDLDNKILHNAIKAFSPLRIRVGGSLQDQVVYKVGSVKKCPHFKKTKDGDFQFSHGCLPMERWDQLNGLFNETGAHVTFSLNALMGRKPSKDDPYHMVGDWNPKNAHDFMNYTAEKGYKIDSYELGNELCGKSFVLRRVDPEQYGKDMIVLKKLVQELYPDRASQPKILGPGGFYDEEWFNTFLQTSGPNVVDGLTHHTYNLGAGVDKDLIDKVQDPYYLDQVAQTYHDISNSVNLFGPWSGAWVGEAGGAYNSGGKDVSHTFVNGFWYLDQLGMTSKFNHKVYCRQALIGGNYALLNTTTFVPNPDYYGALLWHRLMGKNVLSVSHDGSPYLRAYSHCSKDGAGVSVLLINMSNSTTFDVSLADDLKFYPEAYNKNDGSVMQREEYHLTPEGGNIQSDVLLLNGTPLKLTESSEIPELNPKLVDARLPIRMAPDSIVFARVKGFKASACV